MDISVIHAVTYLINVAAGNIFLMCNKSYILLPFIMIKRGLKYQNKTIGVKSYHIHKELVNGPGSTLNTLSFSTGKENQKIFFPHKHLFRWWLLKLLLIKSSWAS